MWSFLKATIVTYDANNAVSGVDRFSRLLSAGLTANGLTVELLSVATVSPLLSVATQSWLDLTLRVRPDVWVINSPFGFGIRRREPGIYVFHGTFAQSLRRVPGGILSRGHRVIMGFLELQGARQRTVVAVSEDTASSVQKDLGLGVDYIVPNGVDTKLFTPGNRYEARRRLGWPLDGRVLLFVGRPEFAKGVDRLFRIQESLREGEYLAIVGAPCNWRCTKCLIVASSNHPAMPLYYQASDVFVLPSRQEGCSFALLEAMATGLPCLTTRVGYAKEIAAKSSELRRWILDEEAPYELWVARARELLQLPDEERVAIGQVWRQWVLQHNDLHTWAQTYRSIIENVVAK